MFKKCRNNVINCSKFIKIQAKREYSTGKIEKKDKKLQLLHTFCKYLPTTSLNLPNDFGKNSEKLFIIN